MFHVSWFGQQEITYGNESYVPHNTIRAWITSFVPASTKKRWGVEFTHQEYYGTAKSNLR